MKKKVQPINRYIIFIKAHVIINLSFGLTDFVLTQWSWLAVSQPKPLTRHELFVRKGYASLVSKRLTQRQSRSQSSFPSTCDGTSVAHAWNCLLPELSFSDRWWRGTKTLGTRLTQRINASHCYLFRQAILTRKQNRVGTFRETEKLSIPYWKVVFIAD